jgi:hypothetical protein
VKWLILVMVVLLGCAKLDVRDETSQEVDQAIEQFDNEFHSQHPQLLQITSRLDVNSPWTARIYDKRGGDLVLWEESGYPRLMLAVKAVEKDYDKYPNGHIGRY